MAKLKGFFNRILKNNRIFTAEDIGEMSSKEFGENEKAIDYQTSTLGIPYRNDLRDNDDVEFVSGYTRADGTQVKAHYRAKSDSMPNPNSNPTYNAPTGFAINFDDNTKNMLQGGINNVQNYQNPMDAINKTVGIFLSNYQDMKNANTIGADKYFHAKANLEAAQQGFVGEMAAKVIGDVREFTDNYRNIYEKGYSLEESLADINEDLKANQEGRDLGRLYPLGSPYELLKHLIPKGLPKKYQK